MKHIIETGTDAASLCLFDPGALPVDFDERAREDSVATFEELDRQGKLWWSDTGGDGGYLFHVYVDEPVPDALRSVLRDPHQRAPFNVPSGALWACGAEYAARDPERGSASTPKGGLANYPHMGGRCQLEPGEYSLTVWRAEWPDKAVEGELAQQLGKSSVTRSNRLGVATGITLFAAFALSIVTLGLTIGALRDFRARLGELALWWGALLALWLLALRMAKAMSRQERDPRRRAVEQRFPSIVVHLERKAP
jgi:hypothetical protein